MKTIRSLFLFVALTFGTSQLAVAQYSEVCEEAVTIGTVILLGVAGYYTGGSGWHAGAWALGSHYAEPGISDYAGGPCQAADLPEAMEGYFQYVTPYPRSIPPEELEYSAAIAQDLMLCGCDMQTVLGAYFMTDEEREEYLRGIGQQNGVTMFTPFRYARPSLSFDPLSAYHDGFNSHSNGGGPGNNEYQH